MAENKGIITPGETLATEEEYAAGKNTRVVRGKIISTALGKAEFDDANKEVRVIGKTIEEVRDGDVVTGQIMLVKESSATVHLLSAENGKKITSFSVAQLPIRNISNEYVTELKKIIKIGDIIRARVMSASELGIDLTTKEKGLGVVKAYCSNCRKEMNYLNGKLNCPECGSIEDRKWFEAEDNYAPRQGGFERREGFGGGRDRGGFRDRGRGGGFGGGRGFSGGGFGRRDHSEFGGHGEGRGGFGGRDRNSFGGRPGRKSFNRPRQQEF